MPKIAIFVEVDAGDPALDLSHEMGITDDTYQRLLGMDDPFNAPLGWLGDVTDVKLVT